MELKRRSLGSTGLQVTAVCIGTSPLGSSPHLYGYEVSAEQAIDTVRSVLTSPFNFLDTSNAYGGGESERRIGQALKDSGGTPPGFVLATKVDPDPVTGDFSGARVRASLEESLERLGVQRIQLLYLHDPERISFDDGMSATGPVQALVALKEEGLVDHIGVAGGSIDLLMRYIETDLFEVVLTHNRYTLIDQSAEPLLRAATLRRMGVVNAAPYGGGMLVKGPKAHPKYAYRRDEESIRQRALQMQQLCERYGVPLAAAALQFSVRDPRIASTAVGVSSPERVQETARFLSLPIPDELWRDLLPLALDPVA
jgi:D-threo-aldose 1-dehydrogenase